MPSIPYHFEELLSQVEGTREGRKLAETARQTKIERQLLGEIMFSGNERFAGSLHFYLEERRRDLTVREKTGNGSLGRLVEWVEAKMCWTDCLARELTKRGNKDDFCEQLKSDVDKQTRTLDDSERDAILTSILFAFHQTEAHPRQKYYPEFGNRGSWSAEDIESEARRHAREVIPGWIGRPLSEEFSLRFDEESRLLVFVYADGRPGGMLSRR